MGDPDWGVVARFRHKVGSWLFDLCFSYVINFMYPGADPNDFMIVDTQYYDVVERNLNNGVDV